MRFYIETYGCTANQGNSEEASVALMEEGHQPSALEDADLVIVNTCVVTERTERNMIKRLCQLQGDRLVIAGCLPKAIPEAGVDIRCRRRLGILSRSVALEIGATFSLDHGPRQARFGAEQRDHLCGIINISEGCTGSCSYCIVRKARGRLVSRSPEEIADSLRALIRSGIVEIQLTSQDTAAYGKDIGSSLPLLLKAITKIPGRYMIRVGMMNPSSAKPILGDLVNTFGHEKIYRFLHLPVQSGSDRVIESMNRGYAVEDFAEIVGRFRGAFPDLTLAADVIAGFPGESEEDFNATENLLRQTEPDKVNVTRFSRRPHTPAWRMMDMPQHVKKARSRRLTKLWQEMAMNRNRPYLGRALPALVTETGREMTMKARSDNYREIVVRGTPALGSLKRVRIVGYNPFYLEGRILIL